MDGVQVAPSLDIAPSTALPLAFLTTTSVSLPWAAVTFSSPLVSTDVAPSRGAMVTRASDCVPRAAVESLPLPLPSPEPDPGSDPRRRR